MNVLVSVILIFWVFFVVGFFDGYYFKGLDGC